MIDYYPKEKYQKAVEELQKNPIPEKFKGLVYCPVNMLFMSYRKMDIDYNSYPIFEEIGLLREDFERWVKYRDIDKNSIDYKKLLREVIIGMASWQWKYSRLLDKKTGVIIHDSIMDQFIMNLEEINTELGLSNTYEHKKNIL